MIVAAWKAFCSPACLFKLATHFVRDVLRRCISWCTVLDLLKEISSLAKHQRGPGKVLVCKGQSGRNTSLEVDPFEDCRPVRVAELLGSLGGIFNLASENHVLVLDIVALDVADQAFQSTFCLVMLTSAA